MNAVMYYWTTFNAFSNDAMGYGWCSVLGHVIPFIAIANLIYGLFVTDSRTLRWAYASWFLAEIAMIMFLFVHGIELLDNAMTDP